jgi:hypothetical protein
VESRGWWGVVDDAVCRSETGARRDVGERKAREERKCGGRGKRRGVVVVWG